MKVSYFQTMQEEEKREMSNHNLFDLLAPLETGEDNDFFNKLDEVNIEYSVLGEDFVEKVTHWVAEHREIRV